MHDDFGWQISWPNLPASFVLCSIGLHVAVWINLHKRVIIESFGVSMCSFVDPLLLLSGVLRGDSQVRIIFFVLPIGPGCPMNARADRLSGRMIYEA